MFKPATRARRAAAFASALSLLMVAACSEGVVEGGGGGDQAEVTLTLVTAALDGTPNAAVQDWYLDELEARSNGRIKIERTEAYSLCDAPEIADCVRDGRAQIGVTIPDYTPQYFPSTSVVSIPFVNQNWQGIMQSLYDLHQNNPDAQAVMDKNNLHFLATWPVGRVLIGTHKPVNRPEQLKGMSTRVSGPLIQQLFENAGAKIVALPAAEAYEGIERGVADSVAAGMDFPVNYKLMELLPYWTDPGIGQYSAFGMWMSQDAYEQMPDDLKKVVDDVAAELSSGIGAKTFNQTALKQCPPMLKAKTVKDLTKWDPAVSEKWEKETGAALQDRWVELAKEQGLKNAQGVLDDYLAGLRKFANPDIQDATLACVEEFKSR